jgi:predicted methyltransferase
MAEPSVRIATRRKFATAAIAGVLITAFVVAVAAAQDESIRDEVSAFSDARIPPEVIAAVDAPERPEADRALDAGRRPKQILAFFGVAPGMQVGDLFAGGGWLTELLSRAVGRDGKVYSVNGEFSERFRQVGENWRRRLQSPALQNVVAVQKRLDSPDLFGVPPGTLDVVLINLNYHDFAAFGLDATKANAEVYKALKPGGVYGIIDHSAEAGSGIRDVGTLHRIDEQHVIDEVTRAGFRLAASSSALRNASDDRTWQVFQRRGETDRFMLKFVKPE